MNEALSAVYCKQVSLMEGAVQVIFALLKSAPILRVDTEAELNLMFHLNYWTFS